MQWTKLRCAALLLTTGVKVILKNMKTIPDIINSDLPWDRKNPASPDAIENLVLKSGLQLPKDYLDFLRLTNGGEGELPVDPYWFQIWSVDEALEHNKGYSVNQSLPGFFAFGGNGGGEMLVFKTREMGSWPIYMIPFVPMNESDAQKLTPDFLSFAKMFGMEEKKDNRSLNHNSKPLPRFFIR